MVLNQKHMELGGKTVISHFTFKPPLVASSDLKDQACFIFPINTQGNIYRQEGKTLVGNKQGVLLKCGTYVNKWHKVDDSEVAEVVILRLFPEVIESTLDQQMISRIRDKIKQRKSTVVVELDILMYNFLNSLFFYFENPSLVNDELVTLKLKELTLLLINSEEPTPILNLFSGFLDQEKYNLKEIVEANLSEDLSLDEIASLANMSTPTFKRKFKDLMGVSPGQYIKNKRLENSAEMLKNTNDTVADIAYTCGFNDPNYFSKAFRQKFGLSPLEFRSTSMSK